MLALLALAAMPMASATSAFAAQPMSVAHCHDMSSQSSPQGASDLAHRACAIACASTCSMILSAPAAAPASALIQSAMVAAPLVAVLDDAPLAVEPPPPR
ncbi:MAG: hypothetical protein ABL874_09495 [Sphingopyxis sp.]